MRKRANVKRKTMHTSTRSEKYPRTRERQKESIEKIKKRGGHWIQKIPGVTV